MNEMVERVAQAMKDAVVTDRVLVGGAVWTTAARAAIAAIREPTEAMRDAGFDAWDDQANSERVLSAWQAMVDAALKNDPKRGPHDEVLERLNAGDLWGAMARAARDGD